MNVPNETECLHDRSCHVVFLWAAALQNVCCLDWRGGKIPTQLLKHITACSDSSHITLIFWFNYSHHRALFEMKSVCVGGGSSTWKPDISEAAPLCTPTESIFNRTPWSRAWETCPKNYRSLWKRDETRYVSQRFATCVTTFACLESCVMNSFLSPRVFTSDLNSHFW